MCSTYYAGFLQLVHKTSCTVVTDRELTLDEGCRTLLGIDDDAGCFTKERIEITDILGTTATTFFGIDWLWQLKRSVIALLVSDKLIDSDDLWSIYESTLYTHRSSLIEDKHITTSDELVGTSAVEDCLGIDGRHYLERHTTREVGLDGTSDDIYGRTLCSDNHVDTDSTSLLGNTGYWQLYLLACCHDEVTILIDDDNDIWEITMAILRIELTFGELLVILLKFSYISQFQEVIAVVHLLTNRVERLDNLLHISDDWFVSVTLWWYLCQEVVLQRLIDREFHHLRVNKDELQLCRMFLVE